MYLAWIFHTRLNDETFSDKTPWYLRFRIKSWKIPVVYENFGRIISQKWDIWSQRFNRPLPSDTWRTREDLVSTAVSVTVIMKRMGEFRIHRVMPGKVHTYLVLVDSDWDSVEHQFLTDREDGGCNSNHAVDTNSPGRRGTALTIICQHLFSTEFVYIPLTTCFLHLVSFLAKNCKPVTFSA